MGKRKSTTKTIDFNAIILAIIAMIGTLGGAYLIYLSNIAPTEMMLEATKTAEARLFTLGTPLDLETQTALSGNTLEAVATQSAQTQTQFAIEAQQATDAAHVLTATAIAYTTATQTAYEIWYSQHQFTDEFLFDSHGWTGDSESSHVELDRSAGQLIYETSKKSRNSFWRCDLCLLPEDHDNYSFEVKYFSPDNISEFNFGFLFGCNQFDEELVNCQGIQIQGNSKILVLQTGPKIEYRLIDVNLTPNLKGLISIRFEVNNEILILWDNDQLIANDIKLGNGAGGMFGLYQDPAGPTVTIERIEINPLP